MSSLIRFRNINWPSSEMENEMNQLLQRFYHRDTENTGGFVPSVNISETDDQIVVTLDAPGMETKDLDISVVGDLLTIKGERRSDIVDKEHMHRIERSYGTFNRSFALPHTVDSNRVQADYKDGVLTIKLPLREEAKPRQIKVNVAA